MVVFFFSDQEVCPKAQQNTLLREKIKEIVTEKLAKLEKLEIGKIKDRDRIKKNRRDRHANFKQTVHQKISQI